MGYPVLGVPCTGDPRRTPSGVPRRVPKQIPDPFSGPLSRPSQDPVMGGSCPHIMNLFWSRNPASPLCIYSIESRGSASRSLDYLFRAHHLPKSKVSNARRHFSCRSKGIRWSSSSWFQHPEIPSERSL